MFLKIRNKIRGRLSNYRGKWSNFRGSRGEKKIIKMLRKSGYEVLQMPDRHEGFDCKVRLDQFDPWIKVQIKTATAMSKNGMNSKLYLKKNNGSSMYLNNEFDWLIAFNPRTGEIWKIPYSAVHGRKKMALLKKFRIIPKPIITL